MPINEGMEFLAYAREREDEEFLVRRWLAPVHSAQSEFSFAEFKARLVGPQGEPETADQVFSRVKKFMEGR